MYAVIRSEQVFTKDYGWHTGRFYFPFADYVDPENSPFGVLTAFNDFRVRPGKGFTTHGHAEVEIISLILEGELVHQDNLGNEIVLKRGDCQYTCTGSGILHSEMNGSDTDDLRFLQVWIEPREKGLAPFYCAIQADEPCQTGCVRHIASGDKLDGIQQIAQDANIYTLEIQKNHQIEFQNKPDRQCLFVCLEGAVSNGEVILRQYDAEKILEEADVMMIARENSRMILVEMAKV